MDPGARSRPRDSAARQLFLLAGAERSPPETGRARARSPAQEPRTRARVGPPEPQGPAGQEQGPPATLRRVGLKRVPEKKRDQRDLHSPRRAARRPRRRSIRPEKRLRRAPPDRQ